MLSIMQSKSSLSVDGVAAWQHAVTAWSSLSPHPASTNMIMVEISPKIVLSSLGQWPVPGLLNTNSWPVHVRHIVAISEGSKLSISAKGILAQSHSSQVAIDFEASNGVSKRNNTSSPTLIVGVIGIGEGGKWRVEAVPWAVKFERVNDTSDWQNLSARSISFVGVAPVAWHSSDKAIFLFRPDSCLEGESLLGWESLPVVRVVLFDA